jgi:hypothetical protein
LTRTYAESMTELLPLCDLDTFVSTRDGLHRVAEHVVAKVRYVDDGEVGLTAATDGFATPFLADRSRVRVDADELVVDSPGGSARHHLNTIAEAAAFVGVEPGFPSELYLPATPLHIDERLHLDRRAAEVLSAWNAFCAEVLQAFADELADARPSPLILWPEHFDQAFYTEDSDESRRANYGASPGDDGHPEPYLYVGPWGRVAPGDYWNAVHFNGGVLPHSSLTAAAEPVKMAMQFLRAGRALLVAR